MLHDTCFSNYLPLTLLLLLLLSISYCEGLSASQLAAIATTKALDTHIHTHTYIYWHRTSIIVHVWLFICCIVVACNKFMCCYCYCRSALGPMTLLHGHIFHGNHFHKYLILYYLENHVQFFISNFFCFCRRCLDCTQSAACIYIHTWWMDKVQQSVCVCEHVCCFSPDNAAHAHTHQTYGCWQYQFGLLVVGWHCAWHYWLQHWFHLNFVIFTARSVPQPLPRLV